jgi:hypothetical protein
MALPAPYLEQQHTHTHTVGTCTSDPQFQTRLKNGRGFESKKNTVLYTLQQVKLTKWSSRLERQWKKV